MGEQSEIEIKTNRIVKLLSTEHLGGVLLNSQHNFTWLSCGKSNAINVSVENGACFLFIRADGKRFVLANNIEMPRILAEEISANDFEPIEFTWQNEKSSSDFIFQTAKSLLENDSEIASDLSLSSNFRGVENVFARCRYSLTKPEIERYKILGNDVGIALDKAFENIDLGETEIEIARKTKNELARFNINTVVTLVAADDRISRFRHPIPTRNIWRKTILIAVCAKRCGLIVNLSRIIHVGKIPDDLRRKTDATARICVELLSETGTGKSGAELYEIAAKSYIKNGFGDEINLHHQGGATDYKTRDWLAHPNCGETVFANQAFAWNPTITGTKIEETAILTENGIEIITNSPQFPVLDFDTNGLKIKLSDILTV